MRIGIDLDNTLIDYGGLFGRLCREEGMSLAGAEDKAALRDAVRTRYGDEAWQSLQARAYGDRMAEAVLFPGASSALRGLKEAGHRVVVISHKTRHSALHGESGPDLHVAARRFLTEHGIDRLVDDVVFTPTRAEKCKAVAAEQCRVFVDDLPEVFRDPGFPASCRKILFGDTADHAVMRRWKALPLLLDPEQSGLEQPGERLAGGRNGRAVRMGDMLRKDYAADGRQRPERDWNALVWLRRRDFPVPEPLGCDCAQGYVVMAHVPGVRPGPDAAAVKAMRDFALRLYSLRGEAGEFPPAADACFSRDAIAGQLAGRLDRLRATPATGDVRRAMHGFLRDSLEPAIRRALRSCRDFGVLPEEFRMPSPSDFGLHNAVRTPGGETVFFDFEYFGLDDPVKLMADVILHPGMTLATRQREAVVSALREQCAAAGDAAVGARFDAYCALWRCKWCCIVLNEFLVGDEEKRTFALGDSVGGSGMDDARLRNLLERQLDTARAILNKSNVRYETI